MVLNTFLNNNHQAIKIHMYPKYVPLNFNKILQLSLPIYCMYLDNEQLSQQQQNPKVHKIFLYEANCMISIPL